MWYANYIKKCEKRKLNVNAPSTSVVPAVRVFCVKPLSIIYFIYWWPVSLQVCPQYATITQILSLFNSVKFINNNNNNNNNNNKYCFTLHKNTPQSLRFLCLTTS